MREPVQRLIVGWPRGGLGYAAHLLQRDMQDVGLSFDHTTSYSNLPIRWQEARAYELSAALVPFLGHPDLQDTPVTFLVRDPMRVLNSLYFHGTFHYERRTPAMIAACRHLPGFQQQQWGKPLQSIVTFLVGWYDLVTSRRPEAPIVRVEDGTLPLLRQLTGLARSPLPYCAPEVNASGCKQLITLAQLPEPVRPQMKELLRRLGYLEFAYSPRGGHAHYVNPDWHS